MGSISRPLARYHAGMSQDLLAVDAIPNLTTSDLEHRARMATQWGDPAGRRTVAAAARAWADEVLAGDPAYEPEPEPTVAVEGTALVIQAPTVEVFAAAHVTETSPHRLRRRGI